MNLENFGIIELEQAKEILTAIINHGYPDDFELDSVSIEFNSYSGEVYLTNGCQVCVLADDELVQWYYTDTLGIEGTREDFCEMMKDKDFLKENYEDVIELMDSFEVFTDDEFKEITGIDYADYIQDYKN